MYGAVGNWVMKATMATIFLISGVLLEVTGFNVALKGNQAPQTLLWMRILFALIPAVFSFAGLVLLYFYPLTERRMGEIRSQLEARRAQVT